MRAPVPSQGFVRAARDEDVDAVVAIQVAAWQAMYAPHMPADVLEELSGTEAAERFREQWRSSLHSPPTSWHHLLVATSAEPPPSEQGAPTRTVAGFAACGPAEDTDLWPGTDAEVYALHTHPDHARAGHGSRLLNAAVDHMADDGFHTAHAWVLEEPNPLLGFLQNTGWAPDGARRELDMGRPVPMVRLHVALGGH
ncbi:GNAT family N-acetyltransferase [Haloactinospora alba]|uniref:GNAT family N-acetyltransferase n=1 Tax=Haloactinospora alba TaxID=405555 RepID=UPI003742A248